MRRAPILSTRDVPLQPVPASERADSLAALRGRLEAVSVPLSDVRNMPDNVRQLRLPRTLPAFIDLHVATDGALWVRRWPRAGRSESIYDVFTPDGRFARTIIVPVAVHPGTPPFITGGTLVGVVMDPETEVQSVVSFHVPVRAAPAVR